MARPSASTSAGAVPAFRAASRSFCRRNSSLDSFPAATFDVRAMLNSIIGVKDLPEDAILLSKKGKLGGDRGRRHAQRYHAPARQSASTASCALSRNLSYFMYVQSPVAAHFLYSTSSLEVRGRVRTPLFCRSLDAHIQSADLSLNLLNYDISAFAGTTYEFSRDVKCVDQSIARRRVDFDTRGPRRDKRRPGSVGHLYWHCRQPSRFNYC